MMQHYQTAARQNWWNPGYLRNPVFMGMGLPGTTDNGVPPNRTRHSGGDFYLSVISGGLGAVAFIH